MEKTRFRHILFSNALEESNNFYPFILFLEKECLSRNLKLKWPLETLRFAAETGDLAFVEFARERYLSSIFEIQIQNAKFEKMQQDIEVLGEGYLKEVEENVPTRLVKIPTDEDVACTLILGAVRSGNVTLFDNLVKIEKKVYNPTNRNVAKVNLAEEALNGKGRRKESDPMLMVHRVVETVSLFLLFPLSSPSPSPPPSISFSDLPSPSSFMYPSLSSSSSLFPISVILQHGALFHLS